MLTAATARGRRVAFDVCYEGPDPAMAISEVAFVELPPGNPDPVAAASERATIARPFVGLGPALLVQLADSMGGSLTHDLTADGRRRLSLLLPAGTKPRGAAAPP